MYMLGSFYRNGRGVEADPKTAVRWLRQAAARGNYRAVSDLGEMFEVGEGVKRNLAQAIFWYGLGASAGRKGDRQAMTRLLDEANDKVIARAQTLREKFLSAISDRARGRFLQATS